jgi:hypothetical protein
LHFACQNNAIAVAAKGRCRQRRSPAEPFTITAP